MKTKEDIQPFAGLLQAEHSPAGMLEDTWLIPEIESMLHKEEAWHSSHKGSSGKLVEWEQGFISGIQYSRKLISKIQRKQWADSAYTLAMMALQSERYQTDPDFRDATDAVLAWSAPWKQAKTTHEPNTTRPD